MAQDNLTIDELLELAESNNESIDSSKPTDVDNYIKKFKITAGVDLVPSYIIYYHYRQWRKTKYMRKTHFFHKFSEIFERKNTQPKYYINAEPFDMSLEGSLKARVFLRKERDVQRQKKKRS